MISWSKPLSQATNVSVESIDAGFRHRIQILKEVPTKGPQFTKGCAVTEEVVVGSMEGRMGSRNKTKWGERDYTDEAISLFNHLKPLMNLWRALMSALDTEFKSSKKPLPRVLNLLRAVQLQRRRR